MRCFKKYVRLKKKKRFFVFLGIWKILIVSTIISVDLIGIEWSAQ